MKIGFTASRALTENGRITIDRVIRGLKADTFIHGACIGGDAFIAQCVKLHHLNAKLIAIVPCNPSQVDFSSVKISDEVIRMPKGTDYRARNEKIVELSDEIVAFWTGRKGRSGTFMTIGIAKKVNKLREVHYL